MSGTTLNASAGSGGGFALLETHTAAASADLPFTTWYSSAYDVYVIELVGFVLSAGNQQINMELSSNGGSTWITTSSYQWRYNYFTSAGSTGVSGNTGQSNWSFGQGIGLNGTAGNSLNGEVRLYNPGSTSLFKTLMGTIQFYENSSGNAIWGTYGGNQTTAVGTAFDAFRLIGSGGTTITVGTARVYGLAT